MNAPGPSLRDPARTRGVTAVLGPTNTGKTHYAIERMLAHPSGVIGLPLRLLAREVYQRVVARVGPEAVALVTGEERIKPPNPRYWVATVEAMPREIDVSFVAVDEIQLAADFDRGHIFCDRLLNRRGRDETLLIGAQTMAPLIEKLLPGVPVATRPRLSQLSFSGARKIARLPPRSAIVAFSAEEVYAIAEYIRRQRGGAAVVLGALSPRTRNAQVEMYQAGDVDYIVATDAIGMGLNLDVDHVAFAADRKFDGWRHRPLTPAEMGQIAGRAGRNQRDGTFGSTGRCPPFDEELVEQIEDHRFDPLRVLQWRNAELDFASIDALLASLETIPLENGLTRAQVAVDQRALEAAGREESVRRQAVTSADVRRLWEACQIPDYAKISPAAHAELVIAIFSFIVRRGRIPADWFARRIAEVDRLDGDIERLSQRIAQVRSWSFIANRGDWLDAPEHWQNEARRVEDSLSDALHAQLTQRFVDRRTSILMRRLRENAMLEAEITGDGDVLVEGHHVGRLQGFRFTADPQAAGEEARTLNAAAQKALAAEIEARAQRVHDAVDTAFTLSNDGAIRWLGEPIAKIAAGDKALAPQARLTADETLTGEALEKVQRRVDLWLAQHVEKLLGPLKAMESGEGLDGLARGIAFRIAEELGVLDRARVANDVRNLSQDERAALRKQGVRFGAYHLYLPALLKPAPRSLAAQLWALKNAPNESGKSIEDVAYLASSGRTSFTADPEIAADLYRVAGFKVAGERAVRVDILERLADLIRPAVAYRPGVTPGEPPAGAADGSGFVVTVGMTSLAGCSGEAFASILKALGFSMETRQGPAITVPLAPAAPTAPIAQPADGDAHDLAIESESAEEKPVEEAAAEPAPLEAPESAGQPAQSEDVAPEPASAHAAPETAVAEAAPASAPAVDGAASEAAAPAMIEVWSPHKREHHQRHHRKSKPEKRAPREWIIKPREEQPRREGGEQRERPKFEGRKFEGKRDGKPRFDRNRERDNRAGDRNDRPFASTEKRGEKNREPDPDSPFAKLLALKAQMEKK
ncbi:MAG: helicase [Hyphomicrobiales bacterium]|nr:helicase [Hyphomicrobiales bacterium]